MTAVTQTPGVPQDKNAQAPQETIITPTTLAGIADCRCFLLERNKMMLFSKLMVSFLSTPVLVKGLADSTFFQGTQS
jgi:hypothetical protein